MSLHLYKTFPTQERLTEAPSFPGAKCLAYLALLPAPLHPGPGQELALPAVPHFEAM
jgi:hypothetical protein